MDAEQLAAIRERAERATAGPWQTGAPTPDAGAVYFGTTADPDDPNEPGVLLGDAPPADAEFIAHARTDVPALLDEIDRLRAESTEALSRLFRVRELCDEWERDEAYSCVDPRECARCTSFQRVVIKLRSTLDGEGS